MAEIDKRLTVVDGERVEIKGFDVPEHGPGQVPMWVAARGL